MIDEKLGLTELYEFDDPEASYSFDLFTIWKRESDGALFYGEDSGCSCPSPYEDVHSIEDLKPITKHGWDSFKKDFEDYCGQKAGYGDSTKRYVDILKEKETLDAVYGML